MRGVNGSSPLSPRFYMYIVYVLKSLKNKKRYVGFSSKNISKRLDWHRWGLTSWTKQNGPFRLIYLENYDSIDFAQKRERFLKTGKGRRVLQNILGPVAQLVRASGS